MTQAQTHPTDKMIGEVHSVITRRLLDTGKCPTRFEVASELKVGVPEVEARLHRLAETHGIVLHPHAPECWLIHPFSTLPTLTWVHAGKRGWWAPCVWCALGVATLAGDRVQVHTRIGAEAEPVVIDVSDGVVSPASEHLVVHFSIPPRLAWQNFHQHCSLVVPFHSKEDGTQWCETHRQQKGEFVPLATVAHLARAWYGTHANKDWRKWTVSQAEEIFRKSGLTSAFWALEGEGVY